MICFSSCKQKRVANLAPNAHQVKAEEVIQTPMYSYVRVSEEDKDYWVAINRVEIKTGETYFWSRGMEMNNFTSKELKRTFPSILFVEDFTDKPITTSAQVPPTSMAGKQIPAESAGISVPKAEGGVTIAELYAGKTSFSGKPVTVRGQVVKFSGGIMNKNFVHLQDGTKDGDKYDLTITTLDSVTKGDVVVFQGTVTLNKDFGAGYFYDLILENAKVKK
jgi:hypothetical protein